jgi:hypothetical protein
MSTSLTVAKLVPNSNNKIKGKSMPVNTHICRTCGSKFNSRAALKKHATTHRKFTLGKSTPRGSKAKSFQLSPMSGRLTNPQALRSMLPKKLGTTYEGSLWAMRALHPCDDTLGGGVPIPDLASAFTCNMETRHYSQISSPNPSDTVNWDCQIVVLPCSDLVAVYRTRPSGRANWNTWAAIDLVANNIMPGTNGIGDAAGGNTNGFAIKSLPTLVKEASSYRQSYKGLTVVPNMNSLSNQGIVTAGQWADISKPQSMHSYAGTTEPSTAKQLETFVFKNVPTDPSDIVNQVPDAGTWEAKYGIYMPMQFPQDTHTYVSCNGSQFDQSSPLGIQDGVSGSPILLADADITGPDDTSDYQRALVYNIVSQESLGDTYYTVAGVINQTLGCAIFSGLAPSASLMVKVRSGIELTADPTSTMSSFMQQAPMKDGVALDMVHATQAKMPLVFEHKYNTLGAIVPLIAKVAAQVLPTVLPHLINFFSSSSTRASPGRVSRTYVSEPPE